MHKFFPKQMSKTKKKKKKRERREKSCAGYVTCTVTHSSQKNCRDMHISTYTHKFISVQTIRRWKIAHSRSHNYQHKQ